MMNSSTKLVFLKHKDNGKVEQFLMTVFGDKEYKNKNAHRLKLNTYLERDEQFSGYILYHDLDGKFVNGWKYRNGKIVAKSTQTEDSSLQTHFKLVSQVCGMTTYYTIYEQCTDWYKQDPEISSNWWYTNTTCYYYYEASFQFLECQSYSTGTGTGGVNGGYKPQVSVTIPANVSAIAVTDSVLLLQAEIDKLSQAITNYRNKNCGTSTVYNLLVSNGVKLKFKVDKTITTPAEYNPLNKMIAFNSEATITDYNLAEELFHAFQDSYHPNGISQYLRTPPYIGRSNIEIEYRLFRGVMEKLTGYLFVNYESTAFADLVDQLCQYYDDHNNHFPPSLTNDQKNLYFQALADLKIALPSYNYPTETLLYPNAAIQALYLTSGCIVF